LFCHSVSYDANQLSHCYLFIPSWENAPFDGLERFSRGIKFIIKSEEVFSSYPISQVALCGNIASKSFMADHSGYNINAYVLAILWHISNI